MTLRKILKSTVTCANQSKNYPCPLGGATFTVTGKKRSAWQQRGYVYCSTECSEAGYRANQSAVQAAKWADPSERERLLAAQRWSDPAERERQSAVMKGNTLASALELTPAERDRRSAVQAARWNQAARARLSETHRRNGHTVPPESAYRSAPTKEEIRLAAALPARWFLHHRLDRGTKHGARSLVEIDLALPAARVAVEVDGPGHRLTKQKAIDRRKEDFLMSRGWRVIRVGNEEVRTALEGCDAFITAVAARPACEEEVAPW